MRWRGFGCEHLGQVSRKTERCSSLLVGSGQHCTASNVIATELRGGSIGTPVHIHFVSVVSTEWIVRLHLFRCWSGRGGQAVCPETEVPLAGRELTVSGLVSDKPLAVVASLAPPDRRISSNRARPFGAIGMSLCQRRDP
jgi:hypothetical protein